MSHDHNHEGRRGLAARYGEEVSGISDDLEAILSRFRNAALGDTVDRVGRDALRKLGRGERLVGAARLAAKGQVPPIHLTRAAAAALVSDPSLGKAEKTGFLPMEQDRPRYRMKAPSFLEGAFPYSI